MTGNISPLLGITRLIALACPASDSLAGNVKVAALAANNVLITSLREIILTSALCKPLRRHGI